jgi:hypothetical protein
MEIYTIEKMKELQRNSDEPESYRNVLLLDKGDGVVCECGSKEFFFAPIVHVRCNKCKRPVWPSKPIIETT